MKKEIISVREKISYGMGDVSCNMVFTLVASYLFFFYTDVAEIKLAAVGMIMVIARLIDAVINPMMGSLVDKTCTKWGKARPYILWMALPMGIILVLTFFSPASSQQSKIFYALGTYILFCIIYTALNIPYTTLMSNLTDNQEERLSFNMYKNIGANIGGLAATGFTLTLVSSLGHGNKQKGFLLTFIFFAAMCVILLIICFKNTHERITGLQENLSLRGSYKVAFKNKPWIILCIIQFLSLIGLVMKNQSTLYYAKYYLENEHMAAILLSISSVLAIPMALIIPKIVKKIGKRNCVISGNLILVVGMIGVYFVHKNNSLVIVFNIVSGVGWVLATGICFVMLAETIDYSEWKTGCRPQGLLTSFLSFMSKMGVAAAGILSAKIFEWGGYVPNVSQTQTALKAITINYIGIPIIIGILTILVATCYTLDKDYASMMQDLRERRKTT